MNACDAYIDKLKTVLPDLVTVRELVKLGIYRSEQAACVARKNDVAPEWFDIKGRGILYPKEGILEFLKRSKKGTHARK